MVVKLPIYDESQIEDANFGFYYQKLPCMGHNMAKLISKCGPHMYTLPEPYKKICLHCQNHISDTVKFLLRKRDVTCNGCFFKRGVFQNINKNQQYIYFF